MDNKDHEEIERARQQQLEGLEFEDLVKEFPHLKSSFSFMNGPMYSNLSKMKGTAFVYKLKK